MSVQLRAGSRLTSFLYIFSFEAKSRRLVVPAMPQLVGSGQSTEDLPRSRTGSINKDICLIKT